jgi:RNA polymerase sigma factor (sigma-70 family)
MENLQEKIDAQGSHALLQIPGFDELLNITDDHLECEDGARLAKKDYLQTEINELCRARRFTVDQEQDYGERLPVQRGVIWDALRQFPAQQGPLEHLSSLPETPEVPLLIRGYRDIKNVMSDPGNETKFREQYGCDLEVARRAFLHLHSLYHGYMEERQAMFLANGRLVVAIARRLQGLGVPINDLIHDGVEGLLHAIDRFSWSETRFSTYAFPCIRGKILRGIDLSGRTITVKQHAVSDILALNRAEALHHAKGKTDDTELCQELGWTTGKLKQVREWRKHPKRIDSQGADDAPAFRDLLVSSEDPSDTMAIRSDCARHAAELIEAAIADVMARKMTPTEIDRHKRDLEFWRLHHTGAGLTHADVAALFGKTPSYVAKCIRRIGRPINSRIRKLMAMQKKQDE